ncbi:helix-turn-helix domain-containing protein [Streptomyces sp. H27-C3]|uniref:helix-turn-helix domain-containing protein n=1 Tax=Streptomyces sp. H27-C3 TaxID=3046305 RepID=UPI0024B9AEF9|nr:helix-turn-helix domain-containing protein [Streptomyces sp. H27-C3]MDJ0466765.1 helix-turn-helix domain-containing protein [Streptomyces sp. H27-C3]
MNQPRETDDPVGPTMGEQVHAAKADIAARLRYVRQQHPEGPFTLAELAKRTGLSKRTLVSAESAEGANLTIETLLKVSHSLGIKRCSYFLDEQVFQQVNMELDAVKALRRRNVRGFALRSDRIDGIPADELTRLLSGIITSAEKARSSLREPPPEPEAPGRSDGP